MENINIEEYIKDLSPELQEKARGCTSADELLKLAEENDIPLPDEVAEAVAGGKSKSCMHKNTQRYPLGGPGTIPVNKDELAFPSEKEVCMDCHISRYVYKFENGAEHYSEWSY